MLSYLVGQDLSGVNVRQSQTRAEAGWRDAPLNSTRGRDPTANLRGQRPGCKYVHIATCGMRRWRGNQIHRHGLGGGQLLGVLAWAGPYLVVRTVLHVLRGWGLGR
jgi:hypothetical protein